MTFELRPYQAEGLTALWDYFQSGKTGHPVIAWPTGTGKSCCPAIFIKYVMQQWPNQKFLMITHVKELIQQNADVLEMLWPQAPLGIYSAGMKRKEFSLPIIYGGIQSMVKHPGQFGHRDIIFIDEAHLVNQDESSMYLSFLATMKLINPNVKVIGMSATPFRMGQGYITDGGLFTDICHDITGIDAFNKLIVEGYLSPLIPLRTEVELDVSNVSINKGEFVASQLQSAVDKAEITYKGLRELVAAGQNRKAWLIFASGIEHSEHIADMLGTFGIDCAAVHSKQSTEYNDKAIKAFKNGSLRAITNYGKLTTGFNYEPIDLIGMFRPTLSVPLWVQMLGRGTRPANGKNNCLTLDYARNTQRLGPINDPIIPRKKGERPGDAPIKLCNSCGAYNHISVRWCCQCGEEFEFKIKIVPKAGNTELLRGTFPVVETFDVQYAIYAPHTSKNSGMTSLKVTYFTGIQSFKEYVCLEHKGLAQHSAHNWWKQRYKSEPPKTVEEALKFTSKLRVPKNIKVHVNKKHPEIVSVQF